MARPIRVDGPGDWHHVMNRSVAKRPMFESPRDMECFVERMEIAAKQYGVEFHAYAILQTHYHLLVRSLQGRLSEAMRHLQAPFARWFNVTRERDGPLFRGRFHSVRVDSLRYRHYLVRYIDSNPVTAGLAAQATDYGWCSAYDYARWHGPTWLTRDWIESEIRDATGTPRYDPTAYSTVFPATLRAEQITFTNTGPLAGGAMAAHGDRVMTFSVGDWRDWMIENAHRADGEARPCNLVPLNAIDAWIAGSTLGLPTMQPRQRSKHSPQNCLHALLLTRLGGATTTELARSIGCTKTTALSIRRCADTRATDDPAFATLLASSARAITRTFWSNV